jgi:flagellar biosynthesis/type III secretory pathway protein FliH
VLAVDELEAKARKLCATILQGSGYWLEASPEHISEGAASHMAEALRSARSDGKREGLEEAAKLVEFHTTIGNPRGVAERIRALKDTK